MYSVLLFGGQAIEISPDARIKIIQSYEEGGDFFEFKETGECIPLKPFPTIVLSERLSREKRKKLDAQGKYECKYGIVHKHEEACRCKSAGREEEKPFAIAPSLKALFSQKSIVKEMPSPSYEENLRARADSGEFRARSILGK